MRIVIALVIVAALGWSGYWVWGARSLDAGIEAAIAGAETDDVAAQAADIRVRGFPNRFDIIAEEPVIAWRARDIVWSAPILSVMSLSYRPDRAIVALPAMQRLEGPFGALRIGTRSARASLRLDRPAGAVRSGNAVIEGLQVSGDATFSASRVLAAVGAAEGRRRRVGLTVDDLALPGELGVVGGATLDAHVTLAAGSGAVAAVDLDDMGIEWGDVGLTAQGSVEADAEGFARGAVSVGVNDWRAALDKAVATGLLADGMRGRVTRGLELMSAMGGGGRLDLPLEFRDGRTFLGPVAIGPAPRLR